MPCSPAVSPGSEARRSSSTCLGLPAAAATASRCCSPLSSTVSSLRRATRARDTGRREHDGALASRGGLPRSSSSSTPSLRSRSPTSAHSSPSTASRASVRSIWFTLAMVGARTLAMGLNRLDRRRARRAESAYRRSRDPVRDALPGPGLGALRRCARCSTSSRRSSSSRSSAGSGRSRSRCSSSTRT